jgi:hypothetical protein
MVLRTRILIDGNETYDLCPRELTARLLTYPANLQFWSLDGLREFLTGTCEVVQAWCRARLEENPPDDLKGKYKRYGTWAARVVKNFPSIRVWNRQNPDNPEVQQRLQEHAVTYLYNIAMAGEGCGLLPGFGMSNNFKDNVRGNPEVQTLRKAEGELF